jgi:hypothetical protein
MKRTLLPLLAGALLFGCSGDDLAAPAGDASPDAGAPDAFDNYIVDVPVVDAAPADVHMPSPVYPAFRPAAPAVANSGGPVLHAPRLVPVFVSSGDGGTWPDEASELEFMRRYLASSTWLAQVSEYGIGAGTVSDAYHSNGAGLPTGTVTASRLRTWVGAQIDAGAWGAADGDTLYVLMLDARRQVQSGDDATCRGIGGYHSDLRDSARRSIAYAVIPDCGTGLDTITRVLSHEIIEAATDPYPNIAPAYAQPSTEAPPEGAWAIAYTGGEVGDMCEHRSDAALRPDELDFEIQRSWSNRAAAAMQDPCVPAIDARPYFNAAPSLPDVVTLATRDRSRNVAARGLVIPVGGSRTIDVSLFSTAPTSGAWRVSARELVFDGASAAFAFRWDRTSGVNGDVLHLTITARDEAPEGRAFTVSSSLGRVNTDWVGAVATE